MLLYDKTNILEGSGIFEVDFAPSHGPAIVIVTALSNSDSQRLYIEEQARNKGLSNLKVITGVVEFQLL